MVEESALVGFRDSAMEAQLGRSSQLYPPCAFSDRLTFSSVRFEFQGIGRQPTANCLIYLDSSSVACAPDSLKSDKAVLAHGKFLFGANYRYEAGV